MSRTTMANREWDLESLTTWGQMNKLRITIDPLKGEDDLFWAWEMLSDLFEDQVIHGKNLIRMNKDLSHIMDECKFRNGKEITGTLRKWVMDINNQYNR